MARKLSSLCLANPFFSTLPTASPVPSLSYGPRNPTVWKRGRSAFDLGRRGQKEGISADGKTNIGTSFSVDGADSGL